MSDNLRDRIANTLYQELQVELPAAIRGADAVIAVIREENDEIRPALRDALASWDKSELSLDQTFELHEKGCVCDDCLPDDCD